MTYELMRITQEYYLNIYDIAVMSGNGIQSHYFQKCNACNNSYSVTKLYINTMIRILCNKDLRHLDMKLATSLSRYLDFLRKQGMNG